MSIIDVLPLESDEDGVGVLHLPLLESQEGENAEITFPDSEALRVECFAFHNKVSLIKRVKEIDEQNFQFMRNMGPKCRNAMSSSPKINR